MHPASSLMFLRVLSIFSLLTSCIISIELLVFQKKKDFPFTYLDYPIYTGWKKVSFFQDLIQKLKVQIFGCQSKLLSMRGYLILIKQVLQSIPVYLLAAIDPPRQIILDIEKLFADFFWGSFVGTLNEIRWRGGNIYRPSSNGLGIISRHHLNDTFSSQIVVDFSVKKIFVG